MKSRIKRIIAIFLIVCFLLSMTTAAVSAQDNDNYNVAVYRWFHATDKDWISLAENEISDAQLTLWGYQDKKFQFYASKYRGKDMVAVKRWFHPTAKDWVSIAENEISDAQMKSWGYQQPMFQFYAKTKIS